MSVAFRVGEEEPLFHLGEFPVRLITLLVGLHCAAMVAATFLLAAGHEALLDLFIYGSTDVSHGQVWRLLTYAFVATPSVWFLLEMLMLWYFGREVESALGWKRFAVLYAGLVLLGPLLLQAYGYTGRPQLLSGSQEVNFAVFAAFVAMHPSARFFFGVAARWVFLALLAISSLQLLAAHQEARVVVLVATSGMAVTLMKRVGFSEPLFGGNFSWGFPWRRGNKQGFHSLNGGLSAASASQAGRRGGAPDQAAAFDAEREMDRLLEKISSKGISSLDAAERASLEKARTALLRRRQ